MAFSLDALSDRSPLISDELEAQLKPLLERIEKPLTLVCVVDGGDKSEEMATFLKQLVGYSSELSLTLLDPGQDPKADEALDPTYLPATGFLSGEDYSGMVFHGVPGGKEFNSFAAALLVAAGAAKPLDKPTLKDISKINQPARLDVCVSLMCHHCAKTVMSAQRIAAENPLVKAHMIDANLYPDLVERYHIERVPIVIARNKIVGNGEMTIPELCGVIRKLK